MEIKDLKVGPLRTHCYLLLKDKEALVIDPGAEAGRIIEALEGFTLKGILLTHAHFDHLGAVTEVKEVLGAPIYLQAEALAEYGFARDHAGDYGFSIPELPEPDFGLGEEVVVGVFKGKAIRTPGHSAGSVSFLFGFNLFSGDTLFKGLHGRTDLPTSDPEAMKISLKKLAELPGETRVYPGHGHFSVIRDEAAWIRNIPVALGRN